MSVACGTLCTAKEAGKLFASSPFASLQHAGKKCKGTQSRKA
jgi:hypothetical protein